MLSGPGEHPEGRRRLGLRRCRWAGRLELTFRQYQALEAGDLHISSDLYERMVDLCGWPR